MNHYKSTYSVLARGPCFNLCHINGRHDVDLGRKPLQAPALHPDWGGDSAGRSPLPPASWELWQTPPRDDRADAGSQRVSRQAMWIEPSSPQCCYSLKTGRKWSPEASRPCHTLVKSRFQPVWGGSTWSNSPKMQSHVDLKLDHTLFRVFDQDIIFWLTLVN